ncbi:multidrug transporter [Candidatus Woesearchaeota archaeon]|nr:MAG: multidrug transporter [Candidatus Woesearchaeota archaeon]
MKLIILSLMFIATWLGAFGSLYLKKGSGKVSRNLLSFLNINLFIGIFLYLLSTGFYIYLLQNTDLTILYPLTSMTYIWVMILSKFKLSETINKSKMISICLIILGIVVIMQ